ncbi:hypothetical protein ABIA39_008554 [Nocardia sp. GAS34]|uniref:hypothetical protein n=1 Tax=unclassified Nocardia TaxID=2637762 RepID=UPI003D232689
MSREFVVPDDAEFVQELGIELGVERMGVGLRDEAVRMLAIDLADDDRVVFSFDVVGRSVRFRRLKGEMAVMDIFREGATRLSIGWSGETRCLAIEFETDSLRGQLEIKVGTCVEILDRMLFL